MDTPYILVLNGPNMNLLGRRNPEQYGAATLEDINCALTKAFPNINLRFAQHNGEGEIIDAIHTAGYDPFCIGIALNAGAYTHYSYAIADAIEAVNTPVVEVHMTNVHAREAFRATSVIAPVCVGSISGFGALSYMLAIEAIINNVDK